MARATPLPLLVLLAACASLFGPTITIWGGPYPLDPVPEEYRAYYAEVEACWGIAGDFDAIEWYGASRIKYGDQWVNGLIQGDRITMVSRQERHVKHEMSHHVSGIGDALHYTDEYGRPRVPCDQ